MLWKHLDKVADWPDLLYISVIHLSNQSNTSSSNVRRWAISYISASPCCVPDFLRSSFPSYSAHEGELQSKVPQESEPCTENLSPLLFEDSPSSTPSLPASGDNVASGGGSEVFGTCVEEAVREMRFRIEQKTTLTASAGEVKGVFRPDVPSSMVSDLKCLRLCMSIMASIAPPTIPARRDPHLCVPPQ